jgi:hypothetical protein
MTNLYKQVQNNVRKLGNLATVRLDSILYLAQNFVDNREIKYCKI